MIEALIVVATIGILGVIAIFAARLQIAKGRDGRRKADLSKIQKALEDYMNDNGCYPDSLSCGVDFKPYLSSIPCDPINNAYFNYFYSYDGNESCKSWYKIYARLEYTKDPIIEKVGCKDGCGPLNNYNYWVSSPNMNKVEQTAGELWWPETDEAVSSPTPTPTLSLGITPTPTLAAETTPTPIPTSTVTPNPTPTSSSEDEYYGCFSGVCTLLPGPVCFPNYINYPDCDVNEDGISECGTPSNPQNECQY